MKEEQTAVIFARHKIFVYCFVVEMLLFLVIYKEAAILLKFAAENMMSHVHFLFCTAGENSAWWAFHYQWRKGFFGFVPSSGLEKAMMSVMQCMSSCAYVEFEMSEL